jgi:transcriptional regulator with GAF, ATPase, and Fis domain
MYDPLIVDSFLNIHSRVAAELQQVPTEAQTALMELTKLIASNKSARPAQELFEFEIDLLREAFRVCHALDALALEPPTLERYTEVARQLQAIAWYDCVVIWANVRQRDSLAVAYSSAPEPMEVELEVPLGDKLTGWVAANKASVLNASPALDVPYSEQLGLLAYQSALSVPLALGEQLVGVLSLYSRKADAYSSGQQRLLEVVAPHLALLLTHQPWVAAVPGPEQQVRMSKPPMVH